MIAFVSDKMDSNPKRIEQSSAFEVLTFDDKISPWYPGSAPVEGLDGVFVLVLSEHVVDNQDVRVTFLDNLVLPVIIQLTGSFVPAIENRALEEHISIINCNNTLDS